MAVDGNINDPRNMALADFPNRLQILDLLAGVTDHLPIIADYPLNSPTALSVTWLEPTPTGFTLHFDRPLDPGALNLYGS